MRRKIELKNGAARKEICEALGISTAGLSLALSFDRNSLTAKQAREMALQRGGVLMEEKPIERKVRILDAKGETVKTLDEQ